MMPRFFIAIALFVLSKVCLSQKPYFQQSVDYSIEVSLDDQNHILRGFETMHYSNQSSDTLRFIYMHLWPNAYKNDRSAYSEQNAENGYTKFYYSKPEERGYIDSLLFKVNGELVAVSNYNNHEDIVMMDLNEPLAPGHSIEISTPFRVKIPYTFSRLGHMGQSYQISQWYPKPAVYDRYGWHPMPYLDQGEFYSEYGTYLVKITLPSNYVVAATGDVQEDPEEDFIEDKINNKDSNSSKMYLPIASSTTLKTISFKQRNIHDFAWFADKNFQIERTMAKLSTGKEVACYSYYQPKNKNIYTGSSQLIAYTITYLSKHVGDYPYGHASIVDGSITAGEGMEYPNVAVLGTIGSKSMLQTVVIHEVGHNWFYGLLGSNEREHPWMDESINSFYEKIIKDQYVQEHPGTKNGTRAETILDKLNGSFPYLISAKNNTDQNIELPSEDFTRINYGGIIYNKAPMMLAYLKNYIGDSIFERAMKRYFKEWHFKHPYPEDFKKIMVEESGKDLNWFFNEGLNSNTKIDFKIQSVNKQQDVTQVHATSRTRFSGPIPVSACIDDSIVQTRWIEYPYDASATFTGLPKQITSFKIDATQNIPELKISNNRYTQHALFHKLRAGAKIGLGAGLSNKNMCYVLPALGYNTYDKFMIGGMLHNIKIPNNQFQFILLSMYSTQTKSPVGSGLISYTLYPQHRAQQITLGIQGRSYHVDESHLNISKSLYLRSTKIKPFMIIDFKNSVARSPVLNQLSLSYTYVQKDAFKYTMNPVDSLYRPSYDTKQVVQYGMVSMLHANNRTFNPFKYVGSFSGNASFIKATLEAHLQIDYFKKGKALYARFFAGKFFDLDRNDNSLALQKNYLTTTYTGVNDFVYDDVYLARAKQSGFLSQQISMKEGGFKIKSSLLSSPIGISDNWLSALNLRTDLPINLPLKMQLFFDAGSFANASKLNSSGNKLLYDGGLEMHFFKDLLIVYAPLILSKDFKDYVASTYSKNKFLRTLSFSLNIDQINWNKTANVISLFN